MGPEWHFHLFWGVNSIKTWVWVVRKSWESIYLSKCIYLALYGNKENSWDWTGDKMATRDQCKWLQVAWATDVKQRAAMWAERPGGRVWRERGANVNTRRERGASVNTQVIWHVIHLMRDVGGQALDLLAQLVPRDASKCPPDYIQPPLANHINQFGPIFTF